MKICIVIQSDAFRSSAGMRIRYDRFRDCLTDPNVTIDAVTTETLSASAELHHDVYVFCKTFDVAALMLARRIRAAGKVVGQDLFDDYFSQRDDPRLERFRQWLADMAPVTNYAVCSTPRMVDVLRAYLPDIRISSIDDPIAGFDASRVALSAASKATLARETSSIEVAWFGIGDNPYFPVGLHDLLACESELALLERLGWNVRLRIVTNRRAFEDGGAELLRGLSASYELVDWSEEAERDVLDEATVAILAVSGQSFSRAKSMNRAVTALNSGCQVLSVGYPLYARLDDFIYRSASDLSTDLSDGNLRVGPATVARLSDKLADIASSVEGADRFVKEARMASAAASKPAAVPIICLIHGRNSTIALHKAVSGLRGLSIGTPFSKAAWNFPVRFDIVARELVMRATPALAARFALPVGDSKTVTIRDLEFVKIDTSALGMAPLPLHVGGSAQPIEDLAVYRDVMGFAQDACAAAFSPVDILFSDTSPMRGARPRPVLVASTPAVFKTNSDGTAGVTATGSRSAAPGRSRKTPTPRSRWTPLLSSSAKARQAELRMVETSPLFDCEWYLAQYSDVASTGQSAARHFHMHGWREGRDPGPQFSTKAYLKTHQDVATQDINPLLHYVMHGEAEGRSIKPSLRARADFQPIG